MPTIRRFVSNAWLAAAPLAILLAIVAAFVTIGLATAIIARVAGTETSENFFANVMTLFGMLVLFAPPAITVYALVSLARWLLARKHG